MRPCHSDALAALAVCPSICIDTMTMITAIIFITTPQTKVMTAQILDEVDAGRFGNAFAYCTVLIVLVLIVLAIASLAINQLNRSMRTAQS